MTSPIEAGARADRLPCPFCGGKGRIYQSQNAAALWRVCCENCDAGPHSYIGLKEAVNRWNARASGALVPSSGGQSSEKAFDKIWTGLEEALTFAKGEQPAARIYVQGHEYVPAAQLAAERERCAAIADKEATICARQADECRNNGQRTDMYRLNTAFHALTKIATAIRAASPNGRAGT